MLWLPGQWGLIRLEELWTNNEKWMPHTTPSKDISYKFLFFLPSFFSFLYTGKHTRSVKLCEWGRKGNLWCGDIRVFSLVFTLPLFQTEVEDVTLCRYLRNTRQTKKVNPSYWTQHSCKCNPGHPAKSTTQGLNSPPAKSTQCFSSA